MTVPVLKCDIVLFSLSSTEAFSGQHLREHPRFWAGAQPPLGLMLQNHLLNKAGAVEGNLHRAFQTPFSSKKMPFSLFEEMAAAGARGRKTHNELECLVSPEKSSISKAQGMPQEQEPGPKERRWPKRGQFGQQHNNPELDFNDKYK